MNLSLNLLDDINKRDESKTHSVNKLKTEEKPGQGRTYVRTGLTDRVKYQKKAVCEGKTAKGHTLGNSFPVRGDVE
ncbi:hypothetical protein K7I13_11520 [Brucepastera parasyntrophica]|uniref:hypothetical protein n=1 Tax=Brucepastera parasyntrophica TaxID=2880008 RepID=UPI002109319E|nr:hypothetical protein [Brucepastera parasyntrophica]ULQ59125.1 hypothetical protein K7I13_11520 [Brucepastera parasyntrophica]